MLSENITPIALKDIGLQTTEFHWFLKERSKTVVARGFRGGIKVNFLS